MIPKTLNMIKMEKNFRAHIEKKYPRQPYVHYSLDFWLRRLAQEFLELKEGIANRDFENVREELADLSNLIDYAFERTFIEEKEWVGVFPQDQGETQLFGHNKRLTETVHEASSESDGGLNE